MGKKAIRTALFPPWPLLGLLLPVSTVFLVYAMLTWEEADPRRIASYVLAAYTLTVWCVRIPALVRNIQRTKQENRYVQRWVNDVRLRVNVSLGGSFLWNTAYAVFQLGLGLYHRSFWFYSLAGYYFSLALVRLILVRHSVRHEPGEKMREELVRTRVCGGIFLAMNVALTVMMFGMIRQNRVVDHHEITTIAMATYTFFTLGKAIAQTVKYRRYESPVLIASKAISLAAACVSMVTLENTMLVTFGQDTMTAATRRLFLGISGGAVSLFIIAMAVYMMVQGGQKIKLLTEKE